MGNPCTFCASALRTESCFIKINNNNFFGFRRPNATVALHHAGKPLPVSLFCREGGPHPGRTARCPSCTVLPARCSLGPHTPFLLPGPRSPASPLLPHLWCLTTHLRMLEATVRRKSSERTPRPRPLSGQGPGTLASTSCPQPRRPTGLTSPSLPSRGPFPLPRPLMGPVNGPRSRTHAPPPCLSPARPNPPPGATVHGHPHHLPLLLCPQPRTEDRRPPQTHQDPAHPRSLSAPPWTCWLPQLLACMDRGAGHRGQLWVPQTQAGGWPGSEHWLVPGEAAGTPVSQPILTSHPRPRGGPQETPTPSHQNLPFLIAEEAAPTPTPTARPAAAATWETSGT